MNFSETGGKHLFGSLFNDAFLIAISVIAGVALLVAIIIFCTKRKRERIEYSYA